MNLDPERNVVVLEASIDRRLRKFGGEGPTRDARCVETIVSSIMSTASVRPDTVARIYSEWEPTPSDSDYLTKLFPRAEVTYSFKRPTDGTWESAMAEARTAMLEAAEAAMPDRGRWQGLGQADTPKRWWQFWR